MAECKACGKAWTDHLGVEPTCALLQEALKILEKLGEPTEDGVFYNYGNSVCVICKTPADDEKVNHSQSCQIGKAKKFIERVKAFASASENQANDTS